MVGASDLKAYFSNPSRRGGAISASQIENGKSNNLFFNVTRAEQVSGVDEYACAFFKNTHPNESMDNFKMWLSSKREPNDTVIRWGYDSVALSSIKFDGVNDYIDCGNDVDLWSKPLSKFSFSVWIFPTAGWDGNDRLVVGHGAASNQAFRLFVDISVAHRIGFRIKDSGGVTLSAIYPDLELNEWNHIVCTYDNSLASANIKIYGNGEAGSTADLTETLNVSAPLLLSDVSNDFQGFMKSFKWYDNKALTQTEVLAIYEHTDDEPEPTYWQQMDDFAGVATADPNPIDSQSGTKVGTLNGAAYNYDAQIIPSADVEPGSIVWKEVADEPTAVKFRKLYAGMYFPIWLWFHVDAGAESRLDDSEIMSYRFEIPQGGTGSSGGGGDEGGGGTGGNPPPTNADYKIAYAADWGCESETDDVIDLIKNGGYDILVGGGDNAYASSSCWISRFNTLKSKFPISAYGNHEYSESGGVGPYKTFFGDSKTYYTQKYQNILFIVIDSNIDMDAGGTQHTTLKNELLASLNDNTITWRIGILHHPMFGADSDHSYNDGNSVQAFHSLFQNNKVNLVLSAHNHNWQRSKQVVYNSGNPESPTVVASSSPYSAQTKGFIHVISGTGGHDSGSSLYSLGGQPGFQAFQNRTHNGIWEIIASNNAQTLTCSFVDIDGNKYDTFVFNA